MVDETLAVFDVVKEPTAHVLATMSWDKIDMSVPNACSRARGGRGLKLTQKGSIISPNQVSPLDTPNVWIHSASHSPNRVLPVGTPNAWIPCVDIWS